MYFLCFFFNDTATTEIYTLSLHDALPISKEMLAKYQAKAPELGVDLLGYGFPPFAYAAAQILAQGVEGSKSLEDRKSTRLNSSHSQISYAVFCLKKKILHSCRLYLYVHLA